MKGVQFENKTTGTIKIKSNEKIVIGRNECIVASTDINDYIVDGCLYIDNYGTEKSRSLYYAIDKHDIEICANKNGIIHGMGAAWSGLENKSKRPSLIKLVNCKNVYIHDLTLIDSPQCTIWVHNCENVVIENVNIIGIKIEANTGIEIDCSRNVKILNCHINTHDDCIVVKTIKNIPSQDIRVENCIMSSDYSAFKIGPNTVGDICNVIFINNIVLRSYAYALKIFSMDGARVRNILVENIKMDNVNGGFILAIAKRNKEFVAGEKNDGISYIGNVYIKNVVANINASDTPSPNITKKVGEGPNIIMGLPEKEISYIEIKNCKFHYKGGVRLKQNVFEVRNLSGDKPEYFEFGIVPASALYGENVDFIGLINNLYTFEEEDTREKIFFKNIGCLRVNT